MNTTPENPFARGYLAMVSERVRMIIYDDKQPPCYRTLHPSQLHLSDEHIEHLACRFNDDMVWVGTDPKPDPDLEAQCMSEGTVAAVIYQVTADHFGNAVHLGDFPTEAAAQSAILQMAFETGHYSRSWEISSAHVPQPDLWTFCFPASSGRSMGYFECFSLPGSTAVGFKLYSTPWSTNPSRRSFDASSSDVEARMRSEGVPEALIRILLLAGEADVRFLFLDPDAEAVPGLPVFPDD
jgi:hypothetical protein